MSYLRIFSISALLSASLAVPAQAQQSSAPTDPRAAALQAAYDAAAKVKTDGPAVIHLNDQADLKLPANQIYIPMPEAGRIMQAMGNHNDPTTLGLIFPREGQWMAVAKWEKSGYIKDDDAKNWNADDLLKSLKEGTEEQNKEREKMGIPAIMVDRWAEAPRYDAASHRLVWSILAKLKQGEDPDPGVNYNTYALGREGYISVNMITSASQIATDKAQAQTILDRLQFNEGKRYADFNPATDKVAEYGLAALIAGVAAKKLGFFAIIAAFLAKFAKLAIAGVIGLGMAVRKFFGKKEEDAPVGVPEDHNSDQPKTGT
jgi:uncharacterized membrane-anchored protein